MRKLGTLVLIAISMQINGLSQCDIKTTNRPDGTIVKYLNPELAGTGPNLELGLSVSSNGEAYFINATIRYLSQAKKQVGSLKIQLQNNDALVLNLYNSELASVKGSNVSIGVYFATDEDIIKLKRNTLVRIVFTEVDGMNQIVTINIDNSLLIRQINCLEKG